MVVSFVVHGGKSMRGYKTEYDAYMKLQIALYRYIHEAKIFQCMPVLPLSWAIDTMPDDECTRIFKRYWFTADTMGDIAIDLNMSKAKVSTICRKGLYRFHYNLASLKFGDRSIFRLQTHFLEPMLDLYITGITTVDQLAKCSKNQLYRNFHISFVDINKISQCMKSEFNLELAPD